MDGAQKFMAKAKTLQGSACLKLYQPWVPRDPILGPWKTRALIGVDFHRFCKERGKDGGAELICNSPLPIAYPCSQLPVSSSGAG